MPIGIAADHGGFELKARLAAAIRAIGDEVLDFGAHELVAGDDYPDFVVPLAKAVAKGEVTRGLAICGSGVGACIAANKVSGVRAALITDCFSAHQGVEDDDMNIMCLGGLVTGYALSWDLVQIFLYARFKGEERFKRRLAQVASLEREQKVSSEVSEMSLQKLIATAGALVAKDKGLLAMDESTPTCNKRFEKAGIPQTEEARCFYREMIVTTPGLSECISGVILYDETIRQYKKDGAPLVNVITDSGIIPGIKVDAGAKDIAGHPGEKITEGLDGLRDRLTEYYQMGARFAKWRAVIIMGDNIPSRGCVEANAHALARYAALCQEAGLVPVVEPEVLMDGEHTLERCFEVTEGVLRTVFNQLYTQRVTLEAMILKPGMVLPGSTCPRQETVDEVADATVRCLLRAVPASVAGIAFLSGGQSGELASARLNAMNARFKSRIPWALTFSFARAIQQPALEIWRGKETNAPAAQKALYHRAKCNSAARRGEYTTAMEGT